MKSFNVRIAVMVLAVVTLLLNAGCGKRNAGQQIIVTPTSPATTETGSKQPQQLSDVLAELEALTTPEGVDAALFRCLKDRLREKLVERFGKKCVCIAPDPLNERNRVDDLHWIGEEDGEVVNNRVIGMQWCYRNLGDYDQNGVVGVADITPLAIHYGESVPDDDNSIQAVLNGVLAEEEGDPEVLDLKDVEAIGQNYGRCADYFVPDEPPPICAYGASAHIICAWKVQAGIRGRANAAQPQPKSASSSTGGAKSSS